MQVSYVRFQVITAVSIKITVLWYEMQYSFVDEWQCIGESCCVVPL